MGPDPAVAAVRRAVRTALATVPSDRPVLAACSGGADSLALAAALAFEAARSGRPAGGVTVDHGLQDGSGRRATEVVAVLRGFGLDPATAVTVTVGAAGGPENAARQARYTALDETAAAHGAAVLLGHTLNDQAETVLLGLARGSGARSLAGMPAVFRRAGVDYLRPLLELDRAATARACAALRLRPWADPHNDDPAYTRVRVRHRALPVLEESLGPGVTAALARTARLLREDDAALSGWADREFERALRPADEPVELEITDVAELPAAVRKRIWRRAAIEAGSPPGALAAVHLTAVDALVAHWHGQRHVDLPGDVRVVRRYGRLLFGPV